MTTQNGFIKQVIARRMFAGIALLLPLCIACGENDITCAGVGENGMVLRVLDSVTNADLSETARATVRTVSGRIDSTFGSLREAVAIAGFRPGSYDVSVSAPSYMSQSRLVTVTQTGSGCSQRLVTQQVTFRLLRSTSAAP